MTYPVYLLNSALVPSGQAARSERGVRRRGANAELPSAAPPQPPPAGDQIIVDDVHGIGYGPHHEQPLVITRRRGAGDAVTGGPCGWRLILEEEPS